MDLKVLKNLSYLNRFAQKLRDYRLNKYAKVSWVWDWYNQTGVGEIAKRKEMKTFLLITTVMFTTPDKDFSGVIVEQFPSKIQCTMQLDKHPNTMIDFGVIGIDIKRKCEEKKWVINVEVLGNQQVWVMVTVCELWPFLNMQKRCWNNMVMKMQPIILNK